MQAVGKVLGAIAVIGLLTGSAMAQRGPAKYGEEDKPKTPAEIAAEKDAERHTAISRNSRSRTPGARCAATARRQKPPRRRRRPSRSQNPPKALQGNNKKTSPGAVPGQ